MDNSALQKIPIILKMDFNTYWNPNRYYSLRDYNAFILQGGRGIGKSTGCYWHVLKDYNKDGSEFVISRRYQSEISKVKGAFDELTGGKVTIEGLGKGGFIYLFNKKPIGYAVTLANQSSFKSGVNFRKVKTWIFDEAILAPHSKLPYLKEEVTSYFFELWSTIFRDRMDYRIFILGNNLDIANPYFEYYKIPSFKDIYADRERGIYCEMIKDKEAFLDKAKKTPLARATQGTEYYDYHYNNKVLVPTGGTLGIKIDDDRLQCRFIVNGKTVNLYYREGGLYAECRDKIIEDDISYIILQRNQPNWFNVRMIRSSDFGRYLSMCFFNNKVTYDSNVAYALLKEAMNYLR